MIAHSPAPRRCPTADIARGVLTFWFDDTPPVDWFRRSARFDARIHERFAALHASAIAGPWPALESTPHGALALILVLDQFSRNLYRDSPQAFAADAIARGVAARAIARRFDLVCTARQRSFFYMPFMHSETAADQTLSLRLFRTRIGSPDQLRHAAEHARIIFLFGRFPHRNNTLARPSTEREIAFLSQGGFAG